MDIKTFNKLMRDAFILSSKGDVLVFTETRAYQVDTYNVRRHGIDFFIGGRGGHYIGTVKLKDIKHILPVIEEDEVYP